MTRAERARQIDEEEFRRESEQALQRALSYSKQKQAQRRRQFLTMIYGEAGVTMPLEPDIPVLDLKRAELRQARRKLTLTPTTYRPPQRYTIDGQTLTLSEWVDRLGVSEATLYMRAKKLGSIEAAIAQGGRQSRHNSSRLVTFGELTMTRGEWAKHLGITYVALCGRISRHGLERAIAMGGPQRPGPQTGPASDDQPGVVSDFATYKGTGGGNTAQESAKMNFSGKPDQ